MKYDVTRGSCIYLVYSMAAMIVQSTAASCRYWRTSALMLLWSNSTHKQFTVAVAAAATTGSKLLSARTYDGEKFLFIRRSNHDARKHTRFKSICSASGLLVVIPSCSLSCVLASCPSGAFVLSCPRSLYLIRPELHTLSVHSLLPPGTFALLLSCLLALLIAQRQ